MKIMKKQSIYALMSAIALAGTIGLASCTSSEDAAENNPGYNSETNEVPVNFVFNVSTGNTPASTRMSQANVQATSSDVFRGMEETSLMSFKLNADDKHVASPQTADKLYGLGSILGNNDIGPDSKNKSHRILELSVPVGTNALVFYGKAKKDLNSDDTQGKISSNLSSNLSDISFSLCPRIPEGESTSEYNTTTFTNYQNILLAIINTVVQSSFTGNISFGSSVISVTDAITWEMYGTAKDAEDHKILKEKKSTGSISGGDDDPFDHNHLICGLGEILSSAFVNFNKFYDTETTTDLRAGSGTAVQKMLVDLYTVVNAVANATPTNQEEAVAQAVGKKIRTNLEKALASGGGKFQDISVITDNDHLNLSYGIPTGNNDLTKFPSVFGVPEGTAVLKYDLATNTYSYRTTIPTYNMGGGDSFNLSRYMYPAELCYFGNSPIRKSAVEVEAENWPEGTTAWDKDESWTNWTTGHVESSTREVAMRYNINYGTSLLKTQVKYGAATLQDNKKAIQEARTGSIEENQTFDVHTEASTKPFTLTGVIIGGQNPTVGWNYLAKSGTANTMIYDRDIKDAQSAIPFYTDGGAKTDPVYTLVWDNWDSSKDGGNQYPIYVALEFKNNSGRSFWGETNLIPDGGTFYIAGKLDPDYASPSTLTSLGNKTAEQYKTDKSLGITWPTKYALPPYAEDGSTKQQRRVFIQDYMTEAVFVIGETSLQKAMIAVPDLRASQLSLGLSVELEWQTGLKFDDVVLGK